MKRIAFSILGLVLYMPLTSWADEAVSANSHGQETRQLLEFQRSQVMASDTARPMSGDVAKRSYQRHVDTHSYKIPESYTDNQQSFIDQ